MLDHVCCHTGKRYQYVFRNPLVGRKVYHFAHDYAYTKLLNGDIGRGVIFVR